MADKTWKAAERSVAATLKGIRIPVTGIDRDGADVETPLLCVQVKHRQSTPKSLMRWLAGICGTAKAKDKIGLLVLHQPGTRYGESLVVLRLADFAQLHGELPRCIEKPDLPSS